MVKMSAQQEKVYDYIWWYNENKGMCPSIMDIADELELGTTTVAIYVETLKEKGLVKSEYGIPRSLKTVPHKN
jgi:Mn-dependent DtxR family transcriptional regulator